jgi:hypothetical protein
MDTVSPFALRLAMIDVLNGGAQGMAKTNRHRARQTPEAVYRLPAGQAKLAVLDTRTPPDAPQDISTGDRRGWMPSRRKPRDLLYFSID